MYVSNPGQNTIRVKIVKTCEETLKVSNWIMILTMRILPHINTPKIITSIKL